MFGTVVVCFQGTGAVCVCGGGGGGGGGMEKGSGLVELV